MPITRVFVRSVRELAAREPGMPTERLARELNAPEALVIMALPVHMRLRARNADFKAICSNMAAWENVEVHLADCSAGWPPAFGSAFAGGAPSGSIIDGNVPAGRGLVSFEPSEAAFPEEEIGYIWFVSNNLRGEESHSVRFFDKQGNHVFSFYLGKDASGGVDAEGKAEYDAMRARFGVIPVPKVRCKGCGQCTCGDKKHAH